jgi:hypothetical protein
MSWIDIGHKLAAAEGSVDFAHSQLGIPIAQDAASLMKRLEREGRVTPWYLIAR